MPNFRIRERLDAGKPVFGTFLKINSPAVVELIGLAGFDFVIIDAEHGCFSHAEIEALIRAAELAGISAVVRTEGAGESAIVHALDSGASGVQVPALASADAAAQAVRHARYHPLGQRGFARASRAAGYGAMSLETYLEQASRTLLAVHVENREMVEDLDALCRVEGVDVLFLGAADLSQSYGVPGEQGHSLVRAAFDRLLECAARHGRHVGAVASSAAEVELLIEQGVTYIAWQSDIGILRHALGLAGGNFARYRQTGSAR